MNAFRGSARLNIGKYGSFKVLDEAPFSVNLENNVSANPVDSDAPQRSGYRREGRY